jgi:hypothetical protein
LRVLRHGRTAASDIRKVLDFVGEPHGAGDLQELRAVRRAVGIVDAPRWTREK